MKWKDEREIWRIRNYILREAKERFYIKDIFLDEQKLYRCYKDLKEFEYRSYMGGIVTTRGKSVSIYFYPRIWFSHRDKIGSVGFA